MLNCEVSVLCFFMRDRWYCVIEDGTGVDVDGKGDITAYLGSLP